MPKPIPTRILALCLSLLLSACGGGSVPEVDDSWLRSLLKTTCIDDRLECSASGSGGTGGGSGGGTGGGGVGTGGGGVGPGPVSIGHPVISEVAVGSSDPMAARWIEIYNASPTAIRLSNFRLRSSAILLQQAVANNRIDLVDGEFYLPDITVEPGAYVVLAGNPMQRRPYSRQIGLVESATGHVPFWTADGFVELLGSSGETVDFMRFGGSGAVPKTAGQWEGGNVVAFPYATPHGRSFVRHYTKLATDTNSAADWQSSPFATPAGRNDVSPDAGDSDADGIPDTAEVEGGTFGGINVHALGARPNQRDMFIEVDYMDSQDPGVIPRKEALAKLVETFAKVGIKAHIDAGTQFDSSSFNPANFNLGQGSNVVPATRCLHMDPAVCAATIDVPATLHDYKDRYFDVRRRQFFRYVLFGISQSPDGSPTSTAVSEFLGNDVLLTMGNFGYTTGSGCNFGINRYVASCLNGLINQQASVLAREIGRTLGLRDGGNEDDDFKPNYLSVMNKLYTMTGVPRREDLDTLLATGPWLFAKGSNQVSSLCDQARLPNTPCQSPATFAIEFSDGSSKPLDEQTLLESDNIGRGSRTAAAFADWNLNNALDARAYGLDISFDGKLKTLTDHDDADKMNIDASRLSDRGND